LTIKLTAILLKDLITKLLTNSLKYNYRKILKN